MNQTERLKQAVTELCIMSIYLLMLTMVTFGLFTFFYIMLRFVFEEI